MVRCQDWLAGSRAWGWWHGWRLRRRGSAGFDVLPTVWFPGAGATGDNLRWCVGCPRAGSCAPHRAGAVHQGQSRAGTRAPQGTVAVYPLMRTNPRERWIRAGGGLAGRKALDTCCRAIDGELAGNAMDRSRWCSAAASPSTPAMSDSVDLAECGSNARSAARNLVASMELCGWGRFRHRPTRTGEPVLRRLPARSGSGWLHPDSATTLR